MVKIDSRHEHALTWTASAYPHGRFICDGCKLDGRGPSFHCALCKFDLHPDCNAAADAAHGGQLQRQTIRISREAALLLRNKRDLVAVGKARDLLQECVDRAKSRGESPRGLQYRLAMAEALLGHDETALTLIEDVSQNGNVNMHSLRHDDAWSTLRSQPRFQAVLNKGKAARAQASIIRGHFRRNRNPDSDNSDTSDSSDSDSDHEALKPRKRYNLHVKPALKEAQKPVAVSVAAPVAPAVAIKIAAPAVAPVAPVAPVKVEVVPAAVPNLEDSARTTEFKGKVALLEEMGFSDRGRVISALVLARGDVLAAVQSLLQ